MGRNQKAVGVFLSQEEENPFLYWSLKYPLKGKVKKQLSPSGVMGNHVVPDIERKIHSQSYKEHRASSSDLLICSELKPSDRCTKICTRLKNPV